MIKLTLSHKFKLPALFIIFFLSMVQLVTGQSVDGKVFNKKGYQAWVTLEDSKVVRGLLWNVDTEKIEIKTDQVKGWKSSKTPSKILEIPVEKIQSIRTKKIRAVLKGYGWGAIIGSSFGAVVALSDDDDDLSILYVPFFGMIGSVIGLIGGASQDKTFDIEMNQQKLRKAIPDLNKRAFWGPADPKTKKKSDILQ